MILWTQSIYLGPSEWGNEIMYKIAEEFLRKHMEKFSDDSTVCVTVHEHAGWFLSFTLMERTDKETQPWQINTVASANDAAVFYGGEQKWRTKWWNAERKTIGPEIRRGECI